MRLSRMLRTSFQLALLIGGAGFVILLPRASAPAAEKGAPSVDTVEFKGWKNNLRLANAEAELIVTLDVGPRVISYRPAGGVNVFKEYADQIGKSGEADWQMRGGHRLWAGPEDLTRTYAPDNSPVAHKLLSPGAVRLTQAPDAGYGIQKEIDLTLAPHGTRVTAVHRITNVSEKPTESAPWALSVMAPGGMEIIPLPPKRPHPGPPKNASSPADYAADQKLILWPFFDFSDPRWKFGKRFITLRQDPKAEGPTKIGIAHQGGWVSYLNAGTLFVKRFAYQDGKAYPDGGVNFETFTNADMLEIESLGPVTKLAPGEKVELTEEWELFTGVTAVTSEPEIEKVIQPLARRK
jgi:hypothetical protein